MGKSIGILEKDKTMRDLLEQLVRGRGHIPVVLSSGREALSEAGTRNFPLLLIGHSAEDLHTLDLCRDIHAILPDCKIVILTASSREWTDFELKERGVTKVLEKPFPRRALLSLFGEHPGPPAAGPREEAPGRKPEAALPVPAATRESILIVDDNRTLVSTMKEVLERHGYRVRTACDGVEAVDIVQKKIFDIILTDIHMPRMDGVEAIQRIKEFSPSSFIVMMTGEGTDSEIREGLTEGGYACIHKPFSLERFLRSIEWYSKAARQSREAWERKKRLEQRSVIRRWRTHYKRKWKEGSKKRRMMMVSTVLVLVTIFLSVCFTLFLHYTGTTLMKQASEYDSLRREMINTLKKSQMRNQGAGLMEVPGEREALPIERENFLGGGEEE